MAAASIPAPRAPASIVLVEDHKVFAEMLQHVLVGRGYSVGQVLRSTAGMAALLHEVRSLAPDVVLVDLDLGAMGDGAELLVPLVEDGTAVLVLTGTQDPVRWGECLALGACGVVAKSGALADLLTAVDAALEGRPVMDEAVRSDLIDRWAAHRETAQDLTERLARLTRREAEVLGELMLGRTVNDIARRSVVSPATVRTQVKSILAKLQVCSQLGAVGVAHEARWAPPAPQPARVTQEHGARAPQSSSTALTASRSASARNGLTR